MKESETLGFSTSPISPKGVIFLVLGSHFDIHYFRKLSIPVVQ